MRKPQTKTYCEVRPVVPAVYRIPLDAPRMSAEALRTFMGRHREVRLGMVTITRERTSWDDLGSYSVRLHHSLLAIVERRQVTFTHLQHDAARQWLDKIAADNNIDPTAVRPGPLEVPDPSFCWTWLYFSPDEVHESRPIPAN